MGDKSDKALQDAIDEIWYSDWHLLCLLEGNEKSKAIIEKYLEPEKSRIDSINHQMNSIHSNNLQRYDMFSSKEAFHDSALLGGIAAGIAGSAFGIAKYLYEERRNASIVQHNQNLRLSLAEEEQREKDRLLIQREEATIDYLKKTIDYSKYTNRKIDKTIPARELLEMLTFYDTEVSIAESGGALFKTKVIANKPIELNGHKASIDGSIMACVDYINIFDLILPLDGVDSCNPVNLIAALPDGMEKEFEGDHNICFKARRLWIVENIGQ